MTHTLTINLDAEQEAALVDMLRDYNAASGQSVTAAEYLAEVLIGAIGTKVKARYDAALTELGAAAAQLPYEERQSLMAQVRASIGA